MKVAMVAGFLFAATATNAEVIGCDVLNLGGAILDDGFIFFSDNALHLTTWSNGAKTTRLYSCRGGLCSIVEEEARAWIQLSPNREIVTFTIQPNGEPVSSHEIAVICN